MIDAAAATPRRRSSATRSSRTTAGGSDHRADGIVVTPSHNPAARRRVQVQRPRRRPGRHRHHRLDRGARQRADRGRAAPPSAAPRRAARRSTMSATMSATSAARSTWTSSPRRGCGSASIRSAGRASATGGRSPSATGSTSPSSTTRRSRLRLHAARLGRQDPDGLLVARGDGRADRDERTLSTSPSPTTPTPTATASSPRAGLMNPNHFSARRSTICSGIAPAGATTSAIGKTAVTSAMVDRVAAAHGRACSRRRSGSNGSSPG